MKARFLLKFVIIAAVIALPALFSSYKPEPDVNESFRNYFASHSSKLTSIVLELDKVFKSSSNFNVDSGKVLLKKARKEYKSIEAFVIHFLPGDNRILNRPIIIEMQEDDEISPYIDPHGFQYLEQLLYSDSVQFFRKQLRNETDVIYNVVNKLKESVQMMEFRERDYFEALQKQLVKQFMLALANFETGDSRTGPEESKAMLEFYVEFFKNQYPNQENEKLEALNNFNSAVDRANEFLEKVKPGDDPDFFTFYSIYYSPVSEKLERLREYFVLENIYNTTAINFQNRTIFDPHAFNSTFFLPARNVDSRQEIIDLGRVLFFDPALSANNLRACASCHQASKAFTDGLQQSMSFEPGKHLTRNAPTIINSVLQRKLFHDGRAFTFQDQAGQVMSNPLEMHNDFSQVAVKLRNSDGYVKMFRHAYKGTEDTTITSRSILNAISEYERSLIGMNSRFDKSISGREQLLNDDEKAGFNIYMGKGNCGSCHFIPLFNGVMPPDYVETEWEIIGVPSLKHNGKLELDPDVGRAAIIDVGIFKHAFKVPTLRNIELTAPYMHNGVFRTLEEVIEFYDIGGGTNLGYTVPLQTLPEDSLHLTQLEKFQLISFLKTLTDTLYLTAQPTTLPEFSGVNVSNSRPIGGDY